MGPYLLQQLPEPFGWKLSLYSSDGDPCKPRSGGVFLGRFANVFFRYLAKHIELSKTLVAFLIHGNQHVNHSISTGALEQKVNNPALFTVAQRECHDTGGTACVGMNLSSISASICDLKNEIQRLQQETTAFLTEMFDKFWVPLIGLANKFTKADLLWCRALNPDMRILQGGPSGGSSSVGPQLKHELSMSLLTFVYYVFEAIIGRICGRKAG
ncbi:hypothetical protein LSH36_142g07039 [Paralvinella palmiformis]|uniref:Uncharacterized protein n=1 Tax=Paralvinella palmiformis TaxID=53620 RepID=A0AAD9JVN3_9ANNE|nr:hypothetical protein LSH36_142g07039 [Paralvinella palmiformis]